MRGLFKCLGRGAGVIKIWTWEPALCYTSICDMIKNKILHIVILATLAFGVYANSLGGEFVYDDKPMIVSYDLVKDISRFPETFVSATSIYGNTNYYRPFQTISNMLDYFLWGRESFGFHLTNVLLHVLTVVLLYLFLLMLFENRAISFISSLFLAVHPVNTSVVSYIAGRADPMLFSFMLLCLLLYVKRYYYEGRVLSSFFSLVFFACALLSKELAMMIPLVLVFFDAYAVRFTDLKKKRMEMQRYYPYLAILGIYIFFRVTRMSFFAEGSIEPFPFMNRMITAPYNLMQYLRILVLPYDLHIGRVPWVSRSAADPRIIFSFIFDVAAIYAAFLVRKKYRHIWFGTCWFLVFILPALNVITPLFYTLAENWLYIPSAGFYIIAASICLAIHEKLLSVSSRYFRYVCPGIVFLVTITLAGVTINQNNVWKDEISLGKNTLRFNPREFKIYNNMGVVYLSRGELDKAEEAFKKCLRIKPDTGMAYFNLYRVYKARGENKKAAENLKKAKKYDPKRVGIIMQKMGISH
jgi:hypothetical protein